MEVTRFFKAIIPLSATLPWAIGLNSIIVILLLYPKWAILWLSFLDPKDLCLPNQFSRGSLQKRSVSTYLTRYQRRNWVASMIELTLIFNLSCLSQYEHLRPASFVKFPWRCWTEYSEIWKDLRKALWSYEDLQSVTDRSGANFGFHSNSRDWLFWMFMISKINPLVNKSVLLCQGF